MKWNSQICLDVNESVGYEREYPNVIGCKWESCVRKGVFGCEWECWMRKGVSGCEWM